MILEVAILEVKPGREAEFEADFKRAKIFIQSTEGYLGHTLRKCIEQGNKYLLLVEWRNLKDHTNGFRTSDQYQEWKKILHHYYDPFPAVEHYETIMDFKGE